MRGPVDYIVVGFDGNKFNGSILKELEKAENNGTIAVLGLAMIAKDDEGNVVAMEETDISDPAIKEFIGKGSHNSGLITDEDVDEVGEILENNTSAGLLVVEHLWAKPLKEAIVGAGGFLIAEGRIHPEAASEIDK